MPTASASDPQPQRLGPKILPFLALFLAFALAGVFFLLKCPPLWRDYDGLIQISNRPNDMTLLQYPPAYPFFSRFHVFAAEIVSGWVHHTKTVINLRKAVTLNDAGICALIISQQTALALALAYFAQVCARGWKARVVIVLLFLSNAAIFIPAQLISTEALSQSLLVLFIALGFCLFRAERISGWLLGAYALCLFALIMTRHANAVFAALMPLGYGLIGLGMWLGRRPKSGTGILPVGPAGVPPADVAAGGRPSGEPAGTAVPPFSRPPTRRPGALRPWKLAALYIAIGIAGIEASDLATRLLCRVFDVEYRAISARGTSEKLGFVDHMTPPEREAFLAQLQARTSDPIVKEAIPLLARHAAWDKQRDEIETILRRTSPQLQDQKLHVEADDYLDRVASLFYASHNHYLIMEMVQATWRTLAQTSAADLSRYFLNIAEWSIDLYPKQPSLDKRTHGLAVCSPEARERIVAFAENPWFRVWAWAPDGAILLVTSLAALFLLIRKIGDPAALIYALAIILVSVLATILTFYYVNFQPRFTSIAALLAFLSLGLVIGSLAQRNTEVPRAM